MQNAAKQDNILTHYHIVCIIFCFDVIPNRTMNEIHKSHTISIICILAYILHCNKSMIHESLSLSLALSHVYLETDKSRPWGKKKSECDYLLKFLYILTCKIKDKRA